MSILFVLIIALNEFHASLQTTEYQLFKTTVLLTGVDISFFFDVSGDISLNNHAPVCTN